MQSGSALMREQFAFNMAALKHEVPSTGSTDLMVSAVGAREEAWYPDESQGAMAAVETTSQGNTHRDASSPSTGVQEWSPYVLHYCQSYKYKSWEFHKSLFSNGWYAQNFTNFIPTPISCGAPLPEQPPAVPSQSQEPDEQKRQSAFMLSMLIPRLSKAFKETRKKHCGIENYAELGLVRPMQPFQCPSMQTLQWADAAFPWQTRYRVEGQSGSWENATPRGKDKCSKEAQMK